MQRHVLLLLSMLVLGCSGAMRPGPVLTPVLAYPFGAETLHREDLRTCAERLTAMAGNGYFDYEQAAFVVLLDDGSFDCSVWPASFARHRAVWSGPVPTRTIALIHTHPRNLPHPSRQDYAEARRLDMPVLVATPGLLIMASKARR